MSTNVKDFMSCYGLKAGDIAPKIYPNNAAPIHSMYRAMKGEQALDIEQIKVLTALAGVQVCDFLRFGNQDWECFDSEKIITVRGKGFLAVYDKTSEVRKIISPEGDKAYHALHSASGPDEFRDFVIDFCETYASI